MNSLADEIYNEVMKYMYIGNMT